MSNGQRLFSSLWWGPARKPFEAIARRTIGKSNQIYTGSLKGYRFNGGLAHKLGIYELHLQNYIINSLHPGDVFYDVGAHIGFVSMLASKLVGHDGIVYSFEPLPANIKLLNKHLTENHIDNCLIVQKAVADHSGTINLHYDSSVSPTPSIHNTKGQSINVRSISLDEFSVDHEWPDLIKVDVEGAEVEVLIGSKKLLVDEQAPAWIIEVHSKELEHSVRSILLDDGYRIQAIPHPDRTRSRYPQHIAAVKY